MPPLPLDERIVVIQRPRNLALCESPQTIPQPSAQISSSSYGQLTHRPHCHPSQSHSPACKSLTLECQRKSSRFLKSISDHSNVPVSRRHTPSHCHSNGTVTLGPRLPSHTHKIDIRLTLDRKGQGDATSNSSVHCKSVKSGRAKCVSSQLDQGQWAPKTATTGKLSGPESRCLQVSQLSTSPVGVVQFVPAQTQLQFRSDQERENPKFCSRGEKEFLSLGHRKKLGNAHQSHDNNSLPYHCYSGTLPHASILNSKFPTLSQLQTTNGQRPFLQHKQQSSNSRDQRPRIFHSLPLSPCSSRAGRFPSPDHTCHIKCTHPFSCCQWKFFRCRSCQGNSGSCNKGGGNSSSFSCVQNDGVLKKSGKEMGLRNLGGCLSNGSTSNTSSSNSTVSDCRGSRFKPLLCTSCSGEAKNFESPTVLRKRLVAGCLPCTPLSSSAPLRAIQTCVMGCNPKSSQAGSSTCSYCSSDPIVVTYNPHRKPLGKGIAGSQLMRKFQSDYDDEDYSASTVWPEELPKNFSHSKAQKNYHADIRTGVGRACGRQAESDSNTTGLVALDCQNLQQYAQTHHTDQAGRQWLQQGRMAAFDFLGSRSRSKYDGGQNSLKRLLNMEDRGMDHGSEQHTDVPFSHSLTPLSASPPSPVSFSPSPSAPSTLIKPKLWLQDKEGGHSLPSAQSLHLALNSLNREQDEERSRMHLSLPLSSSLPASLSDESAMTPDAENAVISPILPFLFLGNERDAQDLDLLLRLNIGYVVNVTTHLPLYHVKSGLRYKRLPATDNSKQNLRQYFEEVFEFIEEAYQSGQGVLVHCQAGVSRSATVVIAYLMKHTLMTMTDAYKYVRSRRPVVSPNLNFMGQLLEFERDLNSGVTPRILMPKLNGVETQV